MIEKWCMRLNGLQVYTPFLVIQYTFVGREASFSCSRGKETLANACFDNQVASTNTQNNDMILPN